MDIFTGNSATNFRNDAGKLSILLGMHKKSGASAPQTRGLGRWKAAKNLGLSHKKGRRTGKKQAKFRGGKEGTEREKTPCEILEKWLY